MKLQPAFRLSAFLMVAAGHLSLALTPEIPWPQWVILFGLLPAAWAAQITSFRIPASFWNWSLVLLLAGCLIYGFWFAEFFFKAGIYFVAYLAGVRLFQLQTPRDYWLLFLLTLLEVCGASILTISLSFLLSLLFYLAAGIITLILFNLVRSAERAQTFGPAQRLWQRPWVNRTFLLSATGLTFALFLATLTIFFLIPRVSRTFLVFSTRAAPRLSGFSETVRLGQVGEIKLDPTPVMRVKIRGDTEPREGLLWRGNAMDFYDGHSWRDTLPYTIYYAPWGTTAQVRRASPLAEQVIQEIYLEPTESTILFGLDQAEAFFFPHPFSLTTAILLHQNDYYSLPLSRPLFDRLLYFVYSRPPRYSAQQLRHAWDHTNPQTLRASHAVYLQLPEGMERIAGLAQEIAGRFSNPYDQLRALERFLEENFTYALETGGTASDNPLEDFLFTRRRGHCEYFASAFAVMLRSLGIPCRMVAGFQRGAWNGYDQYYLVRQSDAHTWVEVFFPGLGFVPFDPTPGASLTYAQAPTLWTFFSDRLDALRYRWDRYVVDYALPDQLRALQRLQNQSFQLSHQLLHLPGRLAVAILARLGISMRSGLYLLAGSAVLLLLYWSRARWHLFPGAKRRPGHRRELQTALALYRRLLRLLKPFQLQLHESETALEFSRRAGARLPQARTEVQTITEFYQQVRFGERPLTPAAQAEAHAALRRLQELLRKFPRKS